MIQVIMMVMANFKEIYMAQPMQQQRPQYPYTEEERKIAIAQQQDPRHNQE